MAMAALRRLLPAQHLLQHQSPVSFVTSSSSSSSAVTWRSFSTQDAKREEDFGDFSSVAQALREISKELGLVRTDKKTQQEQLQLPDTKLLKTLGHHELVHAIRKKHGGFVRVAELMGIHKGGDALELHKQKSSRANRRQKRSARLARHDFY